MINIVRPLATLVLMVVLAGCLDTSDAETRRALPEDVQRDAYAECAHEMSIPLHVHKLKRGSGGLHVLGSDGSGVLVAEAHALNQCARAKLDTSMAAN